MDLVNDKQLLTLLRSSLADAKTVQQKCLALRNLNSYFNDGRDLSMFYKEVLMISNSSEVIKLKKLAYSFFEKISDPHIGELLLDSLKIDFRNSNSDIRGSALQCLVKISAQRIWEEVAFCIVQGLDDYNARVRKIAVLACVDLYSSDKTVFLENNLEDRLLKKIYDSDDQVCSTSLIVLNSILPNSFIVDDKLAISLLTRLSNGIAIKHKVPILRLLLRYVPSSDQKNDVVDILNIIHVHLKDLNIDVFLATCSLFLHLRKFCPHLEQHISTHILGELMSFSQNCSAEEQYVVLCHVKLLIPDNRIYFQQAEKHRSFFCSSNDTSQVKFLKMEILANVLSPSTFDEIFYEFRIYCRDLSIINATYAIRHISKIAILNESYTWKCLEALFPLLNGQASLASAAIVSIKEILVKCPSLAKMTLPKCVDSFWECFQMPSIEIRSKCCIVWCLGVYGDYCTASPYILEKILEKMIQTYKPSDDENNDRLRNKTKVLGGTNFFEEREGSPSLRLNLLVAIVKLFFKRPAECLPFMEKMFLFYLNKETNMNIKDRALFYHRLLSIDPMFAKQIICNDRLIQYNQMKPSEIESDLLLDLSTFNNFNLWISEAAEGNSDNFNLMDFSDIKISHPTEGKDQDRGEEVPKSQTLELDLSKNITSEQFETFWFDSEQLSESISLDPISNINGRTGAALTLTDVVLFLEQKGLKVMASSDTNESMHLFVFAFQISLALPFLVEITLNQKLPSSVIIKGSTKLEKFLQQFVAFVKSTLMGIETYYA